MTTMYASEIEELEPIVRVSRELIAGASLLTQADARYLVRMYYEVQEQRIRTDAQLRAITDPDVDNPILFLAGQWEQFERNAKRVLRAYAENDPVGRWAMAIPGIGEVLSSGLLAHIEIEKAPTVGHIWRFAGVDPTVHRERGTKRPWNADLKVLIWKIGESFVKVSGRDNDIYGHIYAERKALEQERNEALAFKEQAERSLAEKNYRVDTVARQWYEQGKLPPARIHLRAERYATKLFLAHWHEVAYFTHFGEYPPKPYILTQPRHTHWMQAPHPELIPGLEEAQAAARRQA